MKKRTTPITFAALLALLLALLLTPPFVGLADNSDYYRVLQPLGFDPDGRERFYHAYPEYRLATLESVVHPDVGTGADARGGWGDTLRAALFPRVDNELEYVSSQFLFVKAAIALNVVVKRLAGADPAAFDVRFLGVAYAVSYAAGLALFVARSGWRTLRARFVHAALAIWFFSDIGYLLYFHSFYGEGAILATALLTAGATVALLREGEERTRTLALFYGSALLFVSAKVANAPIGALLALFGGSLWTVRRRVADRAIIVVGGAALVACAAFTYAKAPDWMKQVNQYQSIFFGVLKSSPTPEEDARELGLDSKWAALRDTHGYLPETLHDIYGDTFRREVYDRVSFGDVLRFYVLHPGRFAEKLRIAAEHAVFLRPSYLGNRAPGDGEERLTFATRWNGWEAVRKQAVDFAFPVVAAAFAAWSAVLGRRLGRLLRRSWTLPPPLGTNVEARDRVERSSAGARETTNATQPSARTRDMSIARLSAAALLVVSAGSQFALPIVGNGEADLQKHMFLFNVCFDLMLVVGAAWAIDRIASAKRLGAAALAGAVACAVALGIDRIAVPREGCVPADSASSGAWGVHADAARDAASYAPDVGATGSSAASCGGIADAPETAALSAGDAVAFGRYGGETLRWTVIHADETRGYLLWADEAVVFAPFDRADERRSGAAPLDRTNATGGSEGTRDYGSNDWASSDLRAWLNGDFLAAAFSAEERGAIQAAELRNALPSDRIDGREGGARPHYWSAVPVRAEQNYDEAFYSTTHDRVFVLDVQQYGRYAYARTGGAVGGGCGPSEPAPCWLRTPYYSSSSMVRYVGDDGFIYHKDANATTVGVVPALYLRPNVTVAGGDGTDRSPYTIRLPF